MKLSFNFIYILVFIFQVIFPPNIIDVVYFEDFFRYLNNLNSLVYFLKALRVPLGMDASGKLVETVLHAFAAGGVMESCFTSSSTSQSRVRLVELLLAILSLDCRKQCAVRFAQGRGTKLGR